MSLAYRDRERERDWDEVSRPSTNYSVRRYAIPDRYQNDYEYDDREYSKQPAWIHCQY